MNQINLMHKMKHLILILVFVFSLVSCSKNEYKVNFTFNYFDVKANKTYKSGSEDLIVLANNSNELKAAIKETLSNEFQLSYGVDSITINDFEIQQKTKGKIINDPILFDISDINEIYSYLNSFNKTFVFKGSLNRRFKNYSPELLDSQDYETIYLTVKNRQVRLIDNSNRLLFSFEILTTKELEQWKNRVKDLSVDNLEIIEMILKSNYKIYKSHFTESLYFESKEGYNISFLGNNQNFKNIAVDFSCEKSYKNKNDIDINLSHITYSKNGIDYRWSLFTKKY